jgi:putative transposase
LKRIGSSWWAVPAHSIMADYRRYWVPGGTYFFTLVTYGRTPIFADPANIERLRQATAIVQRELPFQFCAAVVLPDHMHFLWTLPVGDSDYAKRIGRLKVFFTRLVRNTGHVDHATSASREKHRNSDIWQRRFWEHTLDDEQDLPGYLDYIHYNPVKHGWATCPHVWKASSFHRWATQGLYDIQWGCCCEGRHAAVSLPNIDDTAGEP